jgi:hypothetical protein
MLNGVTNKGIIPYCTIVREQTIYQWTLSDFSVDDGSGLPCRADAEATSSVKHYQGPTTFRESAIRK